MRFNYDKETDSLYIDFSEGVSADTVEISEGVLADYDAEGKLVGLDIDHASRYMDLSDINVSGFSPAIKPVPQV